MTYSCNSLLQWQDEDQLWLERVLWIDLKGNGVLCLRIEPKTPELSSWPYLRAKEVLDEAVAKDQVRVLERDPFLRPPVDPKSLSEDMRARWDKNRKAIEEIVADPAKMVNRRNRRGQISESAKENGVTAGRYIGFCGNIGREGKRRNVFYPITASVVARSENSKVVRNAADVAPERWKRTGELG